MAADANAEYARLLAERARLIADGVSPDDLVVPLRPPSDVRSFLHLLKAEPTLLPPAPTSEAWRGIDHRTKDEVHSCLRCGARAGCAFVADTSSGPRWLDLCWACQHWLRSGMDQADHEEEMAHLNATLGWA